MQRLQVSANRRFLVTEDGDPFFWLGDTAWELFHRLTREDAALYLRNRAQKGFNVVQAVALSEVDGIDTPNAYGEYALVDGDPERPNEAYFSHIDEVMTLAEAEGIYIAMLPTWGCFVVGDRGPKLFDEENMRTYGRWIGERYADRNNLIWVNGGDRLLEIDGVDYCPVWRALAEGVREGDPTPHLMTFHPRGGCHSSSEWFHDDEWLDFNMMQTGPRKDGRNYERITRDYALEPIKPCMDGEPGYEGATKHRLSDYDVRRYAYWNLFAGGHGHTYGCLEIWQMYEPPRVPLNGARIPWREALDLPGATQMGYVRQLMTSRPLLDRIPDQGLIASDEGELHTRVQATRGNDYAFLYLASGRAVTVQMGRISGDEVSASWFNPKTGETHACGSFANSGTRTFVPPTDGEEEDWVLILDSIG